MSISVTPIPRLIDLAAPAFTLGTANAAGTAATAVASDATLLAFDAVAPANVAASAVVGSATVSSRRDHVHVGSTATSTAALIATHTADADAHQQIEGKTAVINASLVGTFAWTTTFSASPAVTTVIETTATTARPNHLKTRSTTAATTQGTSPTGDGDLSHVIAADIT